MSVPVHVLMDEPLLSSLDPNAVEQIKNVAALPGIFGPALLMPDAHSGFGFPIGGVAAFDPKRGGIVSAGGVGFDIGCGVRVLHTGLTREAILPKLDPLADTLFGAVPTGAGKGGKFRLSDRELKAMLAKGAVWAVQRGLGHSDDLDACEDRGRLSGVDAAKVSAQAKKRFADQLGTLGSGNHYLEVQFVEQVLDAHKALLLGITEGDVLVSIHCGSRGLGHQIATDYVARMAAEAKKRKIALPDRNLACAPINSDTGQDYLRAMSGAVNCAMANRQVIGHLAQRAFAEVLPGADLRVLCDVSHNTCRAERHAIDGKMRTVFVHRKGAARALGPGDPTLSETQRQTGQLVPVGGSMGTASYLLAGAGSPVSLNSAPHGAGRVLSRTAARKSRKGRDVQDSLAHKGILLRTSSLKSVAEEAPEAYKDIDAVIRAGTEAGLAEPVARLCPLACIKG